MQNVYVQTINAKLKIFTLEKFETMSPFPPDSYYSRADYDTKKRTFKPDIDKWPRLCICEVP